MSQTGHYCSLSAVLDPMKTPGDRPRASLPDLRVLVFLNPAL
nr:hypothetical protein [Escherichia coli]